MEQGVLVLTIAPTQEHKKLVEGRKPRYLKAKNYLFQAIGRKIIKTIIDEISSKSIWILMAKKYQRSTNMKHA